MMRRVLPTTLVLVAAMIGGAALADDFYCDGSFADTYIDGNVFVPDGYSCMLDGVEVYGNIEVEWGGALWTTGVKVYGNIQSYGARYIKIMMHSWVEGNVQIDETWGAPEVMDDMGNMVYEPNAIRCVTVYGDVQLKKNYAPFDVSCPMEEKTNFIGGNLQVEETWIDYDFGLPYAISLTYNSLPYGDLQFFENYSEYGGFLIDKNEVGGNLQCQDNMPMPEVGDNLVWGDFQCYDDYDDDDSGGNDMDYEEFEAPTPALREDRASNDVVVPRIR